MWLASSILVWTSTKLMHLFISGLPFRAQRIGSLKTRTFSCKHRSLHQLLVNHCFSKQFLCPLCADHSTQVKLPFFHVNSAVPLKQIFYQTEKCKQKTNKKTNKQSIVLDSKTAKQKTKFRNMITDQIYFPFHAKLKE